MQLILVYGPPAVGKLTIAKELQRITGFKLFHNHLVSDLIESVIDWESTVFGSEKTKLYLQMLELAAKEKTQGLIFTYCYAYPDDTKFINRIVKSIKKHNGEVLFVQIVCSEEKLMNRVMEKSRGKYFKISNKKTLKKVLGQYDLFSEIPKKNSLTIDNSDLFAKKVAKIITKHYKLV